MGTGHPGCNVALRLPHPLQAVNPGRSLFLLYALKSSPRLGLLYLYLFDYTDTFLPFIHTICPLQEDSSEEDIIAKLLVGLQSALNKLFDHFSMWHGTGDSCNLSWKSKQHPAFHLNFARRAPTKNKAGPPLLPEACFISCIS